MNTSKLKWQPLMIWIWTKGSQALRWGLGRAWTFSTRANSMVLETKGFGGSNRGAKTLNFNGHFLERAFGFFCWFASSRIPQEISTCPEKVTQSVWVNLHFHLLIRHYEDSKSKKGATNATITLESINIFQFLWFHIWVWVNTYRYILVGYSHPF